MVLFAGIVFFLAGAGQAMLRWLVEKGPEHGVAKILLEPHMVKRLGVASPLIRFQGCRAARHDDHIHVEVGG